ncbi:hypothetical protein BGZ61DRAFT_374837 [Ilyonectria robusta]|uniref:uncharacterized protein n=1 Tax=Ilyonectria robusta TaxID=1079257 RepID=UPI001E8E67D2|nr:uncharacterized protein BGZ61DRAFT_374837 [Ilyonectria robusta]KAH8652009.1 hypothetical protein BGZ61DRAFT_374837 [Ilyonectria robusta]
MWPLPNLPCELPTATVPEFIDLKSLVEHFQLVFNDVQEEHFVKGAIWRDLFAMTGTLRTFYSASSIAGAWQATASTHLPSKFVIDGEPRVIQAGPSAWVEMSFTFETNGIPATIGYGYISVVPESDGKWRIWQLRTILEQLKSHPDVDVLQPANTESVSETHRTRGELATNGVQPHLHQNGETSTSYGHEDYFDCLIIGGGQAGLSVGGRLKALGVSYVILDKHENVGDNWKTRYDSTKLHTVREFAHLPFERTFPASYPEFLPKDDLASGYRKWASKYDINVWLSTTVTSGTWSTEEKTWRLELLRDGKKSSVCGGNIVFAVGGNSQFPLSPTYENKDIFRGITLHSGEYKNASGWKGKHGVVVGTANTAHDVAEDMLQAGMASVTMVQRSKTYVVPAEHYRETHDRVYKESIPTTVSDRLFFSGPAVLGRIMGSRSLHAKARKEPERFDALEKAGFLLDRDGDISYYLFQRFGGHYMDVGTSAKIASGLIKMKSDSLPIRFTGDGLECANGTFLRADVVVFATGFVGNLRLVVEDLFGPSVASQVDDFWGLDDEGELKGAFKPCGHPAFWYHGGAVGQARYMSRFIALQIKAKLLGTPLPIYGLTPPRNLPLKTK